MTLWVVDAHLTYQQGLNVGHLAAEGVNGLIVKATQGATGYTAPGNNLEAWLASAEAQGLVTGTYHWSTASSATSQLNHWFERVNRAGGFAGRLAAIDFEDPAAVTPKATLLGMVDGFMDRTGGRPLGLYSGKWFIDGYAPWAADYDFSAHGPVWLWDSRYVSGSGWASSLYTGVPESWWGTRYGRMAPTLLQFTSSAQIGGLARVDCSAFRGTIEQLRALTGAAGGIGMNTIVESNLVAEIDALVNGAESVVQTDVVTGKPITKPVVPNIRLRELAEAIAAGGMTDAQVMIFAERLAQVMGPTLGAVMRDAAEAGARAALEVAKFETTYGGPPAG